MAGFGMSQATRWTFDEALAKVPQLLEAEGFGILTQIDVKSTLKAKLGLDFRRYKILGACNPALAHRALTAETEIGLMLPCNVIVYERDDGATVVSAIDPVQTVGAQGSAEVMAVARQVRDKLARVVARVAEASGGAPAPGSA
jgi:uncharacterized protein (DUF302 family)